MYQCPHLPVNTASAAQFNMNMYTSIFPIFFADNSHLVQCLGLSLWMVLINEQMIIPTSPNLACPCINVLTYQSTRLQHFIISNSIQYEYLDQHFAENTKTEK